MKRTSFLMLVAFVGMNEFACVALAGGVFEILWLAVFGLVMVSLCFTAIMALGLRYYLDKKEEKCLTQ